MHNCDWCVVVVHRRAPVVTSDDTLETSTVDRGTETTLAAHFTRRQRTNYKLTDSYARSN